ncbi:hypothetical protein NAEGRDRAFT_80013 [Naegleria gruberi]|uniref:Uncharacterized protein n=1 Tax=Naegleria gruberi TaxID=5762 RepID=D2VHS3_NAEGR|nr:uncharacterized protein NAEGRDRAFT_80013 [Naegleria gruberi]EFC43644.1 hypothetical protein NAEGRDRAFT_80013 [Naegleria gruberi]|eukprot:XP_002676388.1 hypothetical protein NAEGRDRAFT_80013 [Naegleria gruberi strain NEG-M]
MKRGFSQFYESFETLNEYEEYEHGNLMYQCCTNNNTCNNNYSSSSEEGNAFEYSPSNKKKKTTTQQTIILDNNGTPTTMYYNSDSSNNDSSNIMDNVIITATNNKSRSLSMQSILQGQYLVQYGGNSDSVNKNNHDMNSRGERRIALSIVSSELHGGLFNFEIVEWSLLKEEGRSKLDVLSGIIQLNGDNRIGMVCHKKSVFKSLISGPEQYWKCEEIPLDEYQSVVALRKGNQLELKIVVRGIEYTFSKR